jgi:hypothetical protein
MESPVAGGRHAAKEIETPGALEQQHLTAAEDLVH